MIEKEIKIPIFPGKLIVINTEDFALVNSKYKTKIPEGKYDAVTFLDEDDNYVVAFDSVNVSNGIIVHESVHVVNHILDSLDTSPSTKEDELQAYLTQWVFEQITNIFKQ